MSHKWNKYFLDVAVRTAQLSHAKRAKVGCVAVRDRRIVACGYNGTPPGWDNNCEDTLPDGSLVTKSTVIHAEDNLIRFCEEHNISLEGCTLYITLLPCAACAEKIVKAGFHKVKYLDVYRCTKGEKHLMENYVRCKRYEY